MSVPGRWRRQMIGVLGDVDAAWVGHDQFRAALPLWPRRIFVPMTGMVLGRVAADDEDALRLSSARSRIELVIAPLPKDVTRPVTVLLCQKRAQWSMLLRAEKLAGQLGEEEVLLVGTLGRGQHGEGIAAVRLFLGRELARDHVQRGVPVGLDEGVGRQVTGCRVTWSDWPLPTVRCH